ncbi:MAG: hypothetical protein ABSH17_12910, partial [Syntrophobacteraceae bacterium]
DHLPGHPVGQLLSDGMVIPGAPADKLLHCLDVTTGQPYSHGFDGLSFAIQEQSANSGIIPNLLKSW